MKGLLFTELLNYIEKTMSYDVVDKIIMNSNLASGGSYTSIGTYDSQEFFRLVDSLHIETGLPKNKLLISYGQYLFERFIEKYPFFIKEKKSVFEFLPLIDAHIHVDVKKFYPEANPPRFKCIKKSPKKLIMVYQSSRPLADLAEGLITGCIDYPKKRSCAALSPFKIDRCSSDFLI